MNQNFNVGAATLYSIDAAIIIDVIVSFCKCARNCDEYRDNGKVFMPREEIWDSVRSFLPKFRFQRGLNLLCTKGILEYKVVRQTRLNNVLSYTFSDKAKEIFSKNPIRIIINWQ